MRTGKTPSAKDEERVVGNNERGAVLVITLAILTGLALAGLFGATQSTTDTHLAANYKANTQAFFAAEAGIEHARVGLPAIVKALPSPYTSSWTYPLPGTTPCNYNVQIRHKTERELGEDRNGDGDFDDIIYWGDVDHDGNMEQNLTTGKPVEILTSTGRAGQSTASITTELIRDSIDLKYAVWGDKSVETKNSGKVWKGDASEPYVANVGSNEHIEVKDKASIYGSVDIGRNTDGEQGEVVANKGADIYGGEPNLVNRVDPDPLRAFSSGSDLNQDFTSFSSSNDNANATGTETNGNKSTPITITGTTLDLSGSMTLPPGNYYFDSITLKNGATLTADVSSGAVNIFLTGPLEAKEGSTIALTPSGAGPGSFTIFSIADDSGSSSTSIDLKHASDFTGVIYAPKANCQLHNSGNFYGMIWANGVVINNSGEVTYDPSLQGKFMSPNYTLRTWKEERY